MKRSFKFTLVLLSVIVLFLVLICSCSSEMPSVTSGATTEAITTDTVTTIDGFPIIYPPLYHGSDYNTVITECNIEYPTHDVERLRQILSEISDKFISDVEYITPVVYLNESKTRYEIYYTYIFAKTIATSGYIVFVENGYVVAVCEPEVPEKKLSYGYECYNDYLMFGDTFELASGFDGDRLEVIENAIMYTADALFERYKPENADYGNYRLGFFDSTRMKFEEKDGYRYYYYNISPFLRVDGSKQYSFNYLYYTEKIPDTTSAKDPLSSRSIELRGPGKLNEMREMLACGDETRLEQYLQSIADSGLQSKDDLLAFIKIIDSLPSIQILDGDITWICFSHSISKYTGKETSVVYITAEAASGDWTRVEYVLSVTDVSGEISDEKASVGENRVFDPPIKSSDGNLKVHIEMRNPHPSYNGTMIQWTGDACGIFTRIYYFTNSADDIKAEALFENMKINYKSK